AKRQSGKSANGVSCKQRLTGHTNELPGVGLGAATGLQPGCLRGLRLNVGFQAPQRLPDRIDPTTNRVIAAVPAGGPQDITHDGQVYTAAAEPQSASSQSAWHDAFPHRPPPTAYSATTSRQSRAHVEPALEQGRHLLQRVGPSQPAGDTTSCSW